MRNRAYVLNLTEKQAWELLDPVILARYPQPYASPQEEFEAYPKKFQMFADQLEEMPWFKYQRITAGSVIRAMRHYEWKKGWFTFRPGGDTIARIPEHLKPNPPMPKWMEDLYEGR